MKKGGILFLDLINLNEKWNKSLKPEKKGVGRTNVAKETLGVGPMAGCKVESPHEEN